MDEEGLRERKRRRRRESIAAAAMRLFTERGFDQVSVDDVAAAADVSTKTVYNYFPTKADLFFDEGDALLAELLATVRARAVGESALTGVCRFIEGIPEWAEHRRPDGPTRRFRVLIADSPALQAHRRLMFARYERALTEVLTEETNAPAGSAEPFLAAAALISLLRVPFEGPPPTKQPSRLNRTAGRELLATGLAHYAIRPPDHHLAPTTDQSSSAP